ncbi:hypothetical protein IscW_ISCW009399, partial [Ixodes scapularis]
PKTETAILAAHPSQTAKYMSKNKLGRASGKHQRTKTCTQKRRKAFLPPFHLRQTLLRLRAKRARTQSKLPN